MSAEPTGASEPFNLEKLRELIGLMEAHGLSEIDLRRGEERWKLRRGSPEAMQVVPAPGYAAAPAPVPVPAPAPAAPGPVDDPNVVAIKSPTVGTFYESSAPGDAPFVAVGSRVTQESVVCIIEAMKVFNQITADLNGTVTGILVKNGDAVEFGQPLFRVRLG